MYGELRNKVLDLEGHATETYRRIQLSDALYKLPYLVNNYIQSYSE